MKKILITGGNGMLAYDFKNLFKKNYKLFSFDKKELDIRNIRYIEEKISKIKPDIILNFAAYTKVDDAEDIGRKVNFEVNALGVYNLAKLSNQYGIDVITISTDYVFDGTKESGYNENDISNPINSYGIAKYLGEELSKRENKNTIIIRTSWLYGGGKNYKNFVNTMLDLGKKLKSIKVVNDQFGSPTYTTDLSKAIGEIINNIEIYRGKIFHFSNETEGNGITWYEFAKEIFKNSGIKVELKPCTSKEFPTKAKRPKYSKLVNNSTITLRNWKEGLKDYLNNIL